MKKKRLLFLLLLLIPVIVYAESANSVDTVFKTIMERNVLAICCYLLPLALSDKKIQNKFLALIRNFVVRLIVLSIIGFIFTSVASTLIDMLCIACGVIVFWPAYFQSASEKKAIDAKLTNRTSIIKMGKCKSCNAVVRSSDKFCMNCGASLADNILISGMAVVDYKSFDPMYSLNDDKCLETFITKEMEKAGIDIKTKMISEDALKKKKVLSIIMSVLVFVLISLIFFHFPSYTYSIGVAIIVLIAYFTSQYSLLKYLKKTVKERPGEKISNIVMLARESLVKDTSKTFTLIGVILALVCSLGIFAKPRIIYEKMDDGYGVRFYAFGLSNFKTVEIPDEHNGKPIVSLRGNAFSNMPFLEEAELPDSITEIRGQAFLNDVNLKTVKLPKNLKSLGGGAFRNCVKLETVVFGDDVEIIGGGMFEGATNLKQVKLPENLKEIGGEAFKDCTSLESIQIPDKVTRIGGSIFENATSLKTVKLSNSLVEIGGGAFRNCTSLEEIIIPDTVVELGGESFTGDSRLRTVVLSKNLTEIRGNTFENCSSLLSIDIPDKVTRIGGHAFYGASSLATVNIGTGSQLQEIGSSAFRLCNSLRVISLPRGVSVNEKAFKQSPTHVTYFDR